MHKPASQTFAPNRTFPRTIAMVVFPGVQALDVVGPLDVLSEATNIVGAEMGYRLVLVSYDTEPFRASNGMRMVADRALDDGDHDYDLVLVAGGGILADAPPDPRLTAWLKKIALRAREYGSVCAGAIPLGYAGLLDDKTVTTHWEFAPQLARLFPKAKVEPDRIYIRDGRLITAAGVTAGIDLALAIVREDHGADVALKIAKQLLVAVQRQGGQSQFSPLLFMQRDAQSPIARVQEHIVTNINESYSVEKLAKIAGMSARNFARIFTQEAGVTPAEFITRARIDIARNRLEASDRPLKTIAHECGFGSAERMRLTFEKRLGISASQYRASFRRAAP